MTVPQVVVLDVAGRVVRSLATDQALAAGEHAMAWDGLDGSGRRPPAGLYVIRARIGDQSARTRVLLIR